MRGHARGSLLLRPLAGGPQDTCQGVDFVDRRWELPGSSVYWRDVAGCAPWPDACLTQPPASAQFTAKQLEKLAKKAEKDSKAEQAKVKKVRWLLRRGSVLEGHAWPQGSGWGPCAACARL